MGKLRGIAFACVYALASISTFCGLDTGTQGSEGEPPGSSGFAPCVGEGCTPPDSGPTGPVCGDGRITDNEGCDDGNANSGDGCNTACTVEVGWVCPNPGLRCQAAACGDGILAGAEECERPAGSPVVAGCSATCRIDPGYDCTPTTFACAPVVCGDGNIQRGETCEDGNVLPFDGCDRCQKEPVCNAGVCVAQCGDGQRFATEACDDGNTRDGDGCSKTCTIETGFACTDVVGAPPATIDLPVLVRDFIGVGNALAGATGHTDFNQLSGTGVLGIVLPNLGAGGRPVLNCPGGDCNQNPGHLYFGGAARPNISTEANFMQWFTNVAGVNVVFAISAPLQRQANGTYQWDSANPTFNGGKDYFDPVGTGGFVAAGSEQRVCNPLRNCSFTSETHFWFEYQGGERFDFAGDDDTWVFVNGKLAIDLGGLHTPRTGYFLLHPTNGTATFSSDMPQSGTVSLGLTKGGTYEVVMFQAERNQCGSNFKVTLADFNRPKSTCASTCGDGIVASDELCDDGKNDGSYGGCMPGCLLRGPYCGDGRTDPGEQCDDANASNTDGCTTTCKTSGVN